jgi:transposase-like protein
VTSRQLTVHGLRECGCRGEDRSRRWCVVHKREVLDYARVTSVAAASRAFGVTGEAIRRWRKTLRE